MAETHLMLGDCVIVYDDDEQWLHTMLPDGKWVPATPNHRPEDIEMAHKMGYGDDTWAMSRDHEIAHTWLAIQEGHPYSAVMWWLAHREDGWDMGDTAVAREEQRVLDFQQSLVKSEERPWDASR